MKIPLPVKSCSASCAGLFHILGKSASRATSSARSSGSDVTIVSVAERASSTTPASASSAAAAAEGSGSEMRIVSPHLPLTVLGSKRFL